MKKVHFQLTCVAEKRRCVNSRMVNLEWKGYENRKNALKNLIKRNTVSKLTADWYKDFRKTAGL